MARTLTREESKLITRRRLLEAAAKILSETGYGGLSASGVSRAAGIAQPTFYVHFADKDDLVRTLARDKIDEVRRSLRVARRALAHSFGVEALRETFRLPLQAMLEQRELFRLYWQEYHQPASPFGALARELGRELQADLVEDLIQVGAKAETPRERARLELAAEGMIALTQTLGIGYIEGRYDDLDAIIDILTEFAVGALGKSFGVEGAPDASRAPRSPS